MLFQPVWNKVSIQETLFFIIKYRFQILILHLEKYFLSYFQYSIITSCADNKIYIGVLVIAIVSHVRLQSRNPVKYVNLTLFANIYK